MLFPEGVCFFRHCYQARARMTLNNKAARRSTIIMNRFRCLCLDCSVFPRMTLRRGDHLARHVCSLHSFDRGTMSRIAKVCCCLYPAHSQATQCVLSLRISLSLCDQYHYHTTPQLCIQTAHTIGQRYDSVHRHNFHITSNYICTHTSHHITPRNFTPHHATSCNTHTLMQHAYGRAHVHPYVCIACR